MTTSRRYYLLLGWLGSLLMGAVARGQALPPPPDSLRTVLNGTTGAGRAAALLRVARAFGEVLDPATVTYARAAERQARAQGNAVLAGQALDLRGEFYLQGDNNRQAAPLLRRAARLLAQAPEAVRALNIYHLGKLADAEDQPDEALRRYHAAMRIFTQLGDDAQRAEVINSIGLLYLPRGRYDSAARYLYVAVREQHRLGRTVAEGASLANLAAVYYYQDRFADALRLTRQAYALRVAGHDSVGMAETLLSMGVLAMRADSPAVALAYTRQGYLLQRQLGVADELGDTYHDLAATFQAARQLDSAEYYFLRAIRDHERRQDPSLGNSISNLAELYLERGELARADQWAARALALTGGLKLLPIYRQPLLRVQRQVAERQGDYRRAYRIQQEEQTIIATEQQQQTDRLTNELRVQFETEQAEQRAAAQAQRARIAQLRADRQQTRARVLGLAALGLLGGLAVVVAFAWQLRRALRRLALSESALRRLNHTKDRLMSIIGHDLRGPVATFQLAMPLLRRQARNPDPEVLVEITDDLDQRAQTLGTLLDNLLHWARTQNDEVRNHPQAEDAQAALATVARLYQPTAAAKGVTLEIAPAPAELPAAWADPALLGTVLRNLVANAVKFTPAGGRVRLSVAPATAGLTLQVEDTGVGMTPAQLARLFEVGDDRSTTGTAGESGTGLGLMVCQHFCRLLGSELTVQSTPGTGTTFTFNVPTHPGSLPPPS